MQSPVSIRSFPPNSDALHQNKLAGAAAVLFNVWCLCAIHSAPGQVQPPCMGATACLCCCVHRTRQFRQHAGQLLSGRMRVGLGVGCTSGNHGHRRAGSMAGC